MKQEVVILGGQTIDQKDRQLIRSSEYDKLELKHQNLDFTSLQYALLKKMSWCETEMQKYMPLMKQNVKSLS